MRVGFIGHCGVRHRERQRQLLSGGSCVARGIRVHTCLGSSKPNAVHPCLPARSNGGISLISSDGRIVCSNTLDDRLNIAYHANLPEIRSKLFGAAVAGEISSTVPAIAFGGRTCMVVVQR